MLPLSGFRIIDTTDERGALCGRVLADLGADVIYVEPPGGAPFRQAPPRAPAPGANGGQLSLAFAFRNAGKRGITLDICSPSGREDLHRLLATADAWIESHPPGALVAHGFAPDDVRRIHPALVIASITDFGQCGRHRDYTGTDMIGYAMGGMLYRAGAPDRPPVVAPGSQAYDTAAITAAFGVVTALFHRLRTGGGEWLDVSVQEATSNLADWSVPLYSVLGFYGQREGAGMYPVYRCSDGWVRLIIINVKHWRALRAWMGEPPELQDPTYDEFLQRLFNRPTIDPIIQRFFERRSKHEVAHEAQRRGIPLTPVLEPREVLHNEHTRARASFLELEISPGVRVQMPSGFFELDGVRCGPRRRAPAVGEHNEAVTAETRAVTVSRSAAETPGAAPSFPFTGVRVIDFGVGVAGVEVGRLLAEYGADVIKIESRRATDFIRQVIPGPMNPPFASANRCKWSFGVDLKSAEGARLARRLVSLADVVIENSATGAMERLGLGYDDLKQINPHVIMFSTQLLGASGPWKNWSGYGPNAHTVSGLQYLWSYPPDRDRPEAFKPEGSTNIHPDHLVGRLGALAVVANLLRRERDGRGPDGRAWCGVHVQVAQFEALVQLLGDLFMQESLEPGTVQPRGNSSERGVPWGVYPCAGADEWCVINVRTDAEWQALRQAIGTPEWCAAQQYATVQGRWQASEQIDQALAAWTRARAPAEVMTLLQRHGVPAGIVEHPVHQLNDPHLTERGFFQRIDQVGLGPVVLEGAGFRTCVIPPARVTSAPLLGQHTRMICRSWLQMADAEIDALMAAGVLEETLVPE